FPKRGALVRFGRMGKQERRFVDDDVIIGLVDNFEARRGDLRRNRTDGVDVTTHSGSLLRRTWRSGWISLSLPRAMAPSCDSRGGIHGFSHRRDYVWNSVEQEHSGREHRGATAALASISRALPAAGFFRGFFRSAAVSNLVSVPVARVKAASFGGHGLDLP